MATPNVFQPGTYTGSVSFTNAALWSASTPAAGQDLYILDGASQGITIDSGLSQGTNLFNSITTSVLRPKIGGNGTNYLVAGFTTQTHGIAGANGATTGGNELKINTGTWATTVNMLSSKTVSTEGSAVPVCCFLGSNAANALYQTDGTTAIAGLYPNETANFPTVNAEGGTLTMGVGCTNTTFVNNGATFNVLGPLSTQSGTNLSGTLVTRGTGSLAALVGRGGTIELNHRPSSGTAVKTVTLAGMSLDLSNTPSAVSFDTLVLDNGGIKLFQDGQLTVTTTTLSFNNKTSKTVSAG